MGVSSLQLIITQEQRHPAGLFSPKKAHTQEYVRAHQELEMLHSICPSYVSWGQIKYKSFGAIVLNVIDKQLRLLQLR
jgi:hypothetical protein